MHLKKNVFGNTIGLLLEISAKTKDNLKSRQDLVAMKIREDLHPMYKGNGRYELLLASYNLTQDEKKKMCENLRRVRVPSRFSSNIRKLVSIKHFSLCVADRVPPYCNQSDQASIHEDGNHSVVLLLQQDLSKGD
jgi:hypothetical protein